MRDDTIIWLFFPVPPTRDQTPERGCQDCRPVFSWTMDRRGFICDREHASTYTYVQRLKARGDGE